jgi:2-alkyl-3-oxoalkanoate reductase
VKVLVTGASGFVGGWVARALHARGESVRAVYRRATIPDHLARLVAGGAEVLRQDLGVAGEADAAVREVDAVIHAAARTGDWGTPELFREQNLDITVRLVDAASRAGCRCFVYVSTIAVHGFGPHVDSTEEGPYYPLIHPYQVSKKMAEEHVLSRNSPDLRTTCVRPGIVYGPLDTTTLYRLLEAQRLGVRGTLGGGRSLTCPVYVEDLAEAVLLALGQERSAGEVFDITGGERVTWREFLDHAAELQGARPWIDVPLPVARAAAAVLDGLFGFLRIPASAKMPPVTRYRVAQLAYDFHFSIEKARRLLGYLPRVGWQEGLRRAVEAFTGKGR